MHKACHIGPTHSTLSIRHPLKEQQNLSIITYLKANIFVIWKWYLSVRVTFCYNLLRRFYMLKDSNKIWWNQMSEKPSWKQADVSVQPTGKWERRISQSERALYWLYLTKLVYHRLNVRRYKAESSRLFLIDVFFFNQFFTQSYSEKENPNFPNRSRTNDLPITISDALPLSFSWELLVELRPLK